jgi:hypothetical protein
MAQPTIEQRLEVAEYKISILTELLYRLVDTQGDLKPSDFHALKCLRDGYVLDVVTQQLNRYGSGYRTFTHNVGVNEDDE